MIQDVNSLQSRQCSAGDHFIYCDASRDWRAQLQQIKVIKTELTQFLNFIIMNKFQI